MLKSATKPRFLRLFVVMVLLVISFCWLSKWQWETAHDNATRDVLSKSNAQKRVPIDAILTPGAQFQNETSLRPVSAEGRFDPAHTVLVAGRVFHGVNGWWVLTPVIVDGSGARLPVVRGFVTKSTGIAPPPTGHVRVEGALAPGESQSTGSYPAGQIGTIDMGLLLNTWGGTVYNAFIFETGQNPPSKQSSTPVALVPPPVQTKTSLNLQNAAYAVQWIVFAFFAVFMWFKMVRDDALLDRTHTEVLDTEADADPAGRDSADSTSGTAHAISHDSMTPDHPDRNAGAVREHPSEDPYDDDER